jgi:ATP-binding cassette subfamily B protein
MDTCDIDEKKMKKSAKIANIFDFINALPLKFETPIGEDGIGISQGQKQRILIARAIYKEPDFIFLDEATNSLDTENEKIIIGNLRAFFRHRTVIVVAHRLSTVKEADQIVVLEKGRIAEIGTHNELIEARDIYYNLIRSQLELNTYEKKR